MGVARGTAIPLNQSSLFSDSPVMFARGYVYEPDFLSRQEETQLLGQIQGLPFSRARYKQFLAYRRIVSYGGSYDFSSRRLQAADPIADFLHPLRARAAAWAGCAAEDFTHGLVTEYSPGTELGWHRDLPEFDLIVGISLLSSCRMRFRPYPPRPREKSISVELEPRSIYRFQGAARWEWQHSVPPVPALRYSITFRTLRGQSSAA
jgi:alkylated DNA repair dioxygenase AlkB